VNVADDRLTTSQFARRQRVLGAAMRLAADGGYDAVQMRDVAASADVALGTLYRYFSSKDHLLAETLVEWTRDLQTRVTREPAQGACEADRVIDIVQRATRNMERQPRLTAALITAMSSPDPAVKPCQAEVGDIMFEVMAAAMPDLDGELRQGVCQVLTHVWFSALVGWVNGWGRGGDVAGEVEVAARLLFR
jgi:TetR/AcrR family transcriptional regulator, cholesterol catabolism regulator